MSDYLYQRPKAREPASRKCLRCNAQFLSEGSHNRICITCKSNKVFSTPILFQSVPEIPEGLGKAFKGSTHPKSKKLVGSGLSKRARNKEKNQCAKPS